MLYCSALTAIVCHKESVLQMKYKPREAIQGVEREEWEAYIVAVRTFSKDSAEPLSAARHPLQPLQRNLSETGEPK